MKFNTINYSPNKSFEMFASLTETDCLRRQPRSGRCSLESVQMRPATIEKQYWVGGFYSPCEDAYFDLSGRLYAEYRDRRMDAIGSHASWSPSMYLAIAPHVREGSTIVLGR